MFSTDENGFTLVEMMVALVVTMIIAVVMYSSYLVQKRMYLVQDQVVEMQQNLRAGMQMLASDIRMAGLDYNNIGTAGFLATSINDPLPMAATDNDTITFTLLSDNDTLDNDNDGVPDNPGELRTIRYDLFVDTDNDLALARTDRDGGIRSVVAVGIEMIQFNYNLANGTTTTNPTVAQLSDIVSVDVSILARTDRVDHEFSQILLDYNPAAGGPWGPFGDGFRRRLLVTNIMCRNMGF